MAHMFKSEQLSKYPLGTYHGYSLFKETESKQII